MSWTYDTTLTASKDKVRFYASDTESSAAITVTDEEIREALSDAISTIINAVRFFGVCFGCGKMPALGSHPR